MEIVSSRNHRYTPIPERENSLGAYRFECAPRQGKRNIGIPVVYDRTRKIHVFFSSFSNPCRRSDHRYARASVSAKRSSLPTLPFDSPSRCRGTKIRTSNREIHRCSFRSHSANLFRDRQMLIYTVITRGNKTYNLAKYPS
jgi:hypothetical protein